MFPIKNNINKKILAISILFIVFSLVLFKAYFNRFAAFGCFDECFNYMPGYFLLKGRVLYSEIFFNHQMLMPYLSAFIQKILKPESIYFLVLEHRMVVFLFGILMDLMIMYRFGLSGVGFAFLFEATKFYFMGSLFIAEAVLVYPLIYLFGLTWEKLRGEKLLLFDYLMSAFMAWFVIFLREPVLLVTLFLYFLINVTRHIQKEHIFSIGLFSILTVLTFLFTSLPDYIYQVIQLNAKTIFLSEISSYGNSFFAFLQIFLYPLVILFDGKWTFLREILIMLDIIFLIALVALYVKSKKRKLAIFLLVALGLTNLRVIIPGVMFYEAFHMLPWYGLFVFTITLVIQQLFILQKTKKLAILLTAGIIVVFIYTVFSPQAFLSATIDRNVEFKLNFDRYYIYGQAIKYMSEPTDTLFLERWDDLIYWQANLVPSYAYAVYRNPGKEFTHFATVRDQMFKENPPDFYYSLYEKGKYPFGSLPTNRKDEYIELIYVASPSGLFVKKTKIPEITNEQLEKIKTLRFYSPIDL